MSNSICREDAGAAGYFSGGEAVPRRCSVPMLGKNIELHLTAAAEKQLLVQDALLCVEMELYFSCLVRKQVRIRKNLDSPFIVDVSEKLQLGFRPVMTKTCSVASCEGDAPPLSDFPIARPESYIPHWLKLDYKKGIWSGEFGYL